MNRIYLKQLAIILLLGKILLACSNSDTKTNLNSNQANTETEKENDHNNLFDQEPEVILATIQDGTSPPSELSVGKFGELLSSVNGFYSDVPTKEVADKLAAAYNLLVEKGNGESLLQFVEGFRNGVQNSIMSNVRFDFSRFMAAYICYKTGCINGDETIMKLFDYEANDITVGDTEQFIELNNGILELRRQPIDRTKMSKQERELLHSFETLYSELLTIKDLENFKRYGFMDGGPYDNWDNKVQRLIDKGSLINHGIIIGDLLSLGLAYVSSQGAETEVTQLINKRFYQALNPIQVDNSIAPSGKNNYERIKQEYELFGRWKIFNSIVRTSYKYEIYKRGDEYVGFFPQDDWDYMAETLERKGNFFIIKGNNPHSQSGEYYRIDENKNMVLFDQDGELTDAGFRATKDFM